MKGKAPSTQAGEFVREEIHHVRGGKHGARSPEQATAIGLSKARRAGVKVPRKGAAAKKKAKSGSGGATMRKPSAKRSRAVRGALEREGRGAASPSALSKQAPSSARRRTAAERSAAAKKGASTKGPAKRSAAAKAAAQTPARRS